MKFFSKHETAMNKDTAKSVSTSPLTAVVSNLRKLNIMKMFGLQGRFILWFLAVSLVPVIVVGVNSYNAAQDSIRHEVTNSLRAQVVGTEKGLIELISQQIAFVKSLVGKLTIQDQVISMINGTTQEEKDAARSDLKKYLLTVQSAYGDEFLDFAIVGLDGYIYVSAKDASSWSTEFAAERKAKTTEESYIGDLKYNPITKTTGQVIGYPITDKANNIIAYFQIEISESVYHYLLATDEENYGKTGDMYLVGRDRMMKTKSRFSEGQASKQKAETWAVIQAFEKQGYLDGTYQNYRGDQVFGVAHRFGADAAGIKNADMFEKLGWVIVAEKQTSEAFEPIDQLRNTIIMLSGGLMFGVLLLALFASRSISEFVRKPIRKAVENLRTAADQMAAATQQLEASGEQIASSIQQITAGAQAQSAQVEQTSRSVNEIATLAHQVADSATNAADTSTKASQAAQAGGEAGEKAIQGLSEVKITVTGSASTVKILAEKSEGITKIVDTITKISEQTNMLALNAAIEAARAGEAGRGFAVVADEVRKLAESSAASAEQIRELTEDINTQIVKAVSTIEGSNATVDKDVNQIQETLASLQKAASMAEDVASRVQEIAAATQQQSSGTEQIVKSVDYLASVSEQNASAAQQIASSIQQQVAAIQQISAKAQELMGVAEDLQKMAGGKASKADKADDKSDDVKEVVSEKLPKNPDDKGTPIVFESNSIGEVVKKVESTEKLDKHLIEARKHLNEMEKQENEFEKLKTNLGHEEKHETKPEEPKKEVNENGNEELKEEQSFEGSDKEEAPKSHEPASNHEA